MKTPISILVALSCSALTLSCGGSAPAEPGERTITIAGIGAKSGVVRSFGINSEAAMLAAADVINQQGGVRLADGSQAKLAVEFYDDRCNAEEGISVLRRIAGTDAVVAIGPSCSSVAEPLFGILQKNVDDASDSGLQFPVFTDVAIKVGLAKISEWAFRNVPNEITMYNSLFQWLRKEHPDAVTVYGGVEEDFAHSRTTWYDVMKGAAEANGYRVLGESKWLLNDTNFSIQVREMSRADADVIVVAAHAFSTCGLLRELQRQQVRRDVLVGLTSSSNLETLRGCAEQAEGMIIPTSYAPINEQAVFAAEQTARYEGTADLHSMAAWENMFILKQVIEAEGLSGAPDQVQADRRKLRDGLARLQTTEGLLGTSTRSAEREADKPYVFVVASGGEWKVLHNPMSEAVPGGSD